MKAIILCAGYATRLYPLTLTKAKPLLEIKGKPIIEHIVEQLVTLPSIFKIQIVTNGKFHDNFLRWRAQYGYEQFIEILNDGSKSENDRKGAVGDLTYALNRDEDCDDTLIIAGDNYFDFRLGYFVLYASLQRQPLIAIHNVGDKELAKQYGIVELDEDGTVTGFEEKPANPKSTLASIGLYSIPLDHLRLLRDYQAQGQPMDQIGHFIMWLTKQTPVAGYPILGNWYDIGDKSTLELFNGL